MNYRSYTTEQKIKIVCSIQKVKNKMAMCLKYSVSVRSYYYWLAEFRDTGTITAKSKRPKHSPNQVVDAKIIARVKELYRDGRGKIYIHHQLKRENIALGVSAIEGVLRRLNLWRSKKQKQKKRYKGKYVSKIKKLGDKTQMDTKEIMLNGQKLYQYTCIDLTSRHTWRKLYDSKTPENAADFLRYVIETSSFKIESIQTDNGTEFTYRCLNTTKQSQFDLLCEKLNLNRSFTPIATPRFNGVVERVHGTDEREFYQRLPKNISRDELEIRLAEYSDFYNSKRLHSSLNYITIREQIQLLQNTTAISLAP